MGKSTSPRKPRKPGAAAFIGLGTHPVKPNDVRDRLAERDQRQAADDRTEAQRWLGDPPRNRSAASLQKTYDWTTNRRSVCQ